MNRLVGLSLVCLIFVSAHAESEFEGSSWSLQLLQNNDEPIQVQSERKEYDKTGVTVHRKSRGIIENGVYKPISGDDVNDVESSGPFKIKFLRNNEQDTQKKNFVKGEHKRYPFGRHGFWDKKESPWGKRFQRGPREEAFHNEGLQMHRPPMPPMGIHNPMTENSKDEEMQNKLRNRSRVSFYRPVERMFEKLFGINKEKKHEHEKFQHLKMPKRHPFWHGQNQALEEQKKTPFWHRADQDLQKQKESPFWHGRDQNSRLQQPIDVRPVKMDRRHFDRKRLLENYEKQQQALMKKMQELEESFLVDFYGEEE